MSRAPDPNDPDLNPGEYGFAGPPPEKRDAPPTKHDKFAGHDPEEDEEDEPRPRKRKKKRRTEEEEPDDEPAPKKKRRDLAEEPPPPLAMTYPWWFWTAVLAGLGVVGLVIAAVYAGTQGGAKVGAIAFAVSIAVVLFQTVCVAVLMVFIGAAFGIDYGPVKQGVVKLVGSVAFVNGFTLAFGLLCYGCVGPLGILCAMSTITLVAFVVVQNQFQLNMYEALLTVGIVQGAAWLMAAGLAFTVLHGMMK